MATVFINCRREDSAGEARALFEELRGRLGLDSVFMDVEAIALGRDFRAVLAQRLATVDVMLALIGKGWLDSRDDENKRRLDDPNDFVRGEIRAALERDIPVTPLLVQDAQMPREADLPSDMRDLAFRNAFELSHARWGSDVNELVHRLGLTLSQPSSATIVTGSPAPGKPAANEPPTFARAGSTALVGRGRTLS